MQYKCDEIYKHFKNKHHNIYEEETHCKLLINVMMDREKGCHTYFCSEAMISERSFYHWVNKHELFGNIFYWCKMVAKQLWYEEGKLLRDREYQMGTVNYQFEHWKLLGWSKFGISKNNRIRINVDHNENAAQHYAAIIKQASEGEFTASEFKQLMEAVNVGLNVMQVFELQKQIDELKSDVGIVKGNNNVDNPFADKRN